MKPKTGREGVRRGGARWGTLMAGAFLAGLLAAGAAILLSGQDRKEQGASSSFAPAPQTQQPAPPLSPQSGASRLAIVIDDLGYEPSMDAEWLKFPEKATAAVIPFGPSSRKVAETARSIGWSVILHVPMEPEGSVPDRTERFRVRRGMSEEEIEALLRRIAENVPAATGASNHMGSAATADHATMAAYASVLKKRGLFLLDSVTTPHSVAFEAARSAGVPATRRDVVLDAGPSPEEMRRKWEEAIAVAKEKGQAILVCHARGDTLRMILELLPRLREENVEAVTLDEIVRAGKDA